MIDIYKAKHDLNPNFMTKLFEERVFPYNLRRSDKLQLRLAKTTGFGIDTGRFVGEGGGGVWETLLPELRIADSLKIFKSLTNTHKCDTYTCRLCKTFYPHLGFVL